MSTYFISRHAGAVAWAETEGFIVDQQLAHLEPSVIQSGDIIIGNLPINLIAAVNARGGRYFHLTLTVPMELRGKELSAEAMREYGARLEEYYARKLHE